MTVDDEQVIHDGSEEYAAEDTEDEYENRTAERKRICAKEALRTMKKVPEEDETNGNEEDFNGHGVKREYRLPSRRSGLLGLGYVAGAQNARGNQSTGAWIKRPWAKRKPTTCCSKPPVNFALAWE